MKLMLFMIMVMMLMTVNKQSGLLITLDQINIHSYSFFLITRHSCLLFLSIKLINSDDVYDSGNDVNDN